MPALLLPFKKLELIVAKRVGEKKTWSVIGPRIADAKGRPSQKRRSVGLLRCRGCSAKGVLAKPA